MGNKKWYENAIMLNRDPDWLLHWCVESASRETMLEDLERNFDDYARYEATDVLLEVFTQGSYIPSNVAEWIAEDWRKVKDTEPDYYNRWEPYYKCYVEYGLDPVQIFIDQVTKRGKRAWVSMRMNDCHWENDGNGGVRNLVNSQMWRDERDAGHLVGDEYGYYKICYNFAYPRYRNMLLDYIDEILGKYDFFGIEFNFLREIYCLDYKNDPECHKIMTQFLRDAKERVRNAEKRVGHKIEILIRLPRSISTCMEFGFDVKTMVEERLVDAINPSPRWETVDSGLPVREWLKEFGDKVGILPGIEVLNAGMTYNMPIDVKAYMASFYAQGAPGFYLYNFFWYDENNRKTWQLNRENCTKGFRRFTVMHQDCFAYPTNQYKPLPIELDNNSHELPVEIGPIKSNDIVKLRINFLGDELPTVSVQNKKDVKGEVAPPIFRPGDNGLKNVAHHTPVVYDISGIETDSPLTVTFSGKGTIKFVDFTIDAK